MYEYDKVRLKNLYKCKNFCWVSNSRTPFSQISTLYQGNVSSIPVDGKFEVIEYKNLQMKKYVKNKISLIEF